MVSNGMKALVILGVVAVLAMPRTLMGQVGPDPRRETMEKLAKPLSVDFKDARLEDVFEFLETVSLVDLEVMWQDDQYTDGLDKDQEISVTARNAPTLSILERVLAKAQLDFDENTWQMGDGGRVEVGPKSRLNRFKRLEMYDIQDLLFQVNNYSEVPELDLDAAIQQGGQGGGGGGGSIFQDDQNEQAEQPSQEEQAQRIIDLIIEFVEPEQWRDNGGDGGTITYYREGVLLVRAPDYIHRQLGGYAFWPRYLARTATARATAYEQAYARAQRAIEEQQRAKAKEAGEEGSGDSSGEGTEGDTQSDSGDEGSTEDGGG